MNVNSTGTGICYVGVEQVMVVTDTHVAWSSNALTMDSLSFSGTVEEDEDIEIEESELEDEVPFGSYLIVYNLAVLEIMVV